MDKNKNDQRSKVGAATTAPKPTTATNIPEVTEFDKMSGSSQAIFLASAMNRYGVRDPKETNPKIIIIQDLLDFNGAIMLMKMAIQNGMDAPKFRLEIAETNVKEMLETFNSVGLSNIQALPESTENKAQGTLDFQGEIKPEVKEQLKQEIAREEKIPNLNPGEWANDKEAKEALLFMLSQQKNGASSCFSGAYMCYKLYKERVDKENAEKYKDASIKDLLLGVFDFVDYQETAITRSIASVIKSNVLKEGGPIAAHTSVKRNFPTFTDAQVADIVKALAAVAILKDNRKANLTTDPLFLSLKKTQKEDYLNYVTKALPVDKEMFGRVYKVYHEELGPDDSEKNPTLLYKMYNKMLEIGNYYREDENKMPLAAANTFADELTKVMEALEKSDTERGKALKLEREKAEAEAIAAEKADEIAKQKSAKTAPATADPEKKPAPKKDPVEKAKPTAPATAPQQKTDKNKGKK